MLSNIPFIPLTLYWLWKVFIITSHFPFHSVLICRQRISTGTSCRFFFDQPPMSANTRSVYIVYLKNGIYVCPASCSAFMDECKERFHAWCCHWLAISAALTTKVGQFQNLFWATKKKELRAYLRRLQKANLLRPADKSQYPCPLLVCA